MLSIPVGMLRHEALFSESRLARIDGKLYLASKESVVWTFM